MDIYDIVIVAPNSSFDLVLDNNLIGLIIFAVAFLIAALIALFYRRFIAICTLNQIYALLKHQQISYKHFAYLLAQILCYKHRATSISKENPPFKSSKDKHYLWIALVDILNDSRYGKEGASGQSHEKLLKTAREWLRHY